MDLTPIIDEIYNNSTSEEKMADHAKTICSSISSNQIRLVDVVESLGQKLTSVEVEDRVKAMDLLSQIFEILKPDLLTEKELIFIVDFLLDRLKDQHIVIPKVFICILPIVRCKNLPEGSTSKLLNQLFREGNIQSHTHKHRRTVFLTFQYALQNRLDELKKLSPTDFVMNFLQSMDGEKDPRNLLVLFQSIPIILTHFPLGPFVEDFFEVLSCYFPIDFKPSAPVPGGEVITREYLAELLHICLSQTNQFCKHLVPLLMEKLDSSVIDAKLDALELLGMCCERSYTAQDINPFLATIWHALRREIFMGGNELVETACINFLRFAFRLLSRDEDSLRSCVTMIFSECKHHLSEPELRLSQPTARILTAMAEGSQESCRIVLSVTIPLLHGQFFVKPMSSIRKGLLSIMTTIISTTRLYPSVKLASALPNWDEVLAMWFTLLSDSDPEFVILSLEFFAKLLNNSLKTSNESELQESSKSETHYTHLQPSNSGDDENLDRKARYLLQEHLLSLLLKSDVSAEVGSSIITVMVEIAKSFGEEFTEISVPKLLPLVTSSSDENEIQQSVLNSLAECSAFPIVSKHVIPHLLNLVDSESGDKILLCLASIVERGCENNTDAKAAREFTNFMCVELNSLNVFLKVSSGVISVKPYHSHLLDVSYVILTRIVRILARSAGESTQQELVNTVWNNRVRNSSSDCTGILEEIPALLLEALLASVRPSVEILQRNQLMEILLDRITRARNLQEQESTRAESETRNLSELDEMAIIRLYAVLLNKSNCEDFTILQSKAESAIFCQFKLKSTVRDESGNPSLEESSEVKSPESDSDLGTAVKSGTGLLDNSYKDNRDTKRVMVFLATVVKALAMRGVSDLDKWIGKVMDLLSIPEYGFMMSNEFSTLMSDCPYSLNAKSFCNFKFLYKQRLFHTFVPKLVTAYKQGSGNSHSGGTKANYMRTLNWLLKHVPGFVLQMHIDEVFPLLVGSLSIDSEMNQESNVQILLSTLTTLRDFFQLKSEQSALTEKVDEEMEQRSTVIEYFHDIVPRLLHLIEFKPNMEIRILALKCLQCCAKLPTHIVLPLKPKVTRSLKNSLDDPKRLVRKEAVSTINIWILIGAPGGM